MVSRGTFMSGARYTLRVDPIADTRATRLRRNTRTDTPVAAGSLERFTTAAGRASGVLVRDLSPVEELEVRTRNTCYRITILAPQDSRVLVQGGAFFPIPCEALLSGGSLGGSLLKLGWIGRGFCLEILHEGRRIITTPVRHIKRVTNASLTPQ